MRERAWQHRGLWIGSSICLLLLACALLSLVWTPHPALEIDMGNRLAASSSKHWLGTDALGRDVLSQLLVGARSPLLVGAGAVVMGLIPGTLMGLLAAQERGWVESVVLKLTDVAFAFPALLTAIMLAAVWGAGTLSALLAIGLFNIPTFARISRASARPLWTRDFVLAARVAGKPRWRITLEHVLPHVVPVLLVQASVQFALAILAEAALSYLGLGTQPPQPSWGRMLADAQTLLYQRPMLAVYPGVCIALAVLGLNFLGDGLRDVLDPKMDVRLR
ncbi:MAG: ABC transporter permease [Brachymonas sp.]|nr:ABC transporter permease [Brachymonas sp.]